MRRRILTIIGVVIVANVAILAAAIVYALFRPEPAGIAEARGLVASVGTPSTMVLAGRGTDQKAPYRDYLVNDDQLRSLSEEMAAPPGFVLDEWFRGNGEPRRSGDWLVLASWSGPGSKRNDKQCSISVESTKAVRVEGSALSADAKRAVEQGGRTLVRVSVICDD